MYSTTTTTSTTNNTTVVGTTVFAQWAPVAAAAADTGSNVRSVRSGFVLLQKCETTSLTSDDNVNARVNTSLAIALALPGSSGVCGVCLCA